MEQKTLKRTIFFNLFLASFILLDICLPGKEQAIQQLEYFYGSKKTTGSRKKTTEFRDLVLLSNGDTFLIGKYPEKDYKSGQKIKLVKSALFGNINEIIVLNDSTEKIQVGYLSNFTVGLLFSISVLITLISIYYRNKIFQIALVFSTMSITIISLIYIFYYSQ